MFEAEVFVAESEPKRAVVEGYGATFVDRREPVADYVARLTAAEGFDIVYDTSEVRADIAAC